MDSMGQLLTSWSSMGPKAAISRSAMLPGVSGLVKHDNK